MWSLGYFEAQFLLMLVITLFVQLPLLAMAERPLLSLSAKSGRYRDRGKGQGGKTRKRKESEMLPFGLYQKKTVIERTTSLLLLAM